MNPPTLEFLVESDPDAGWIVRSPAVGVWAGIPVDGTLLAAGYAGLLVQGGKKIPVRLPAGVVGVVSALASERNRFVTVEWGQELFRLTPIAAADEAATAATGGGEPGAEEHALRAPTDGVFYSRPRPDAPPFVKPGDTVVRGQPIGLIEVMKTFNHVLFEGPGEPESARIDAVLVEDGDEVRAGDALLRYQ